MAALLAAAMTAQAADTVRIKLATLAPKDTSFHKSLLQMGDQWRQVTGGAVTLNIYTDGTMGGEADMVRRMRVGQLQAAMLSVAGLSQIDESVRALQLMPMMFRTFDEFEYAREKMRPELEKGFADKGFVVLFWGDAGWVRFFSKQAAIMPEEMKKTKMFVWSGDPRSQQVMKAIGINAVPLEQTDVLTGLQTGLIDSVPSVPFYALAGQFFGPAPHMLEVNWVPLVGATVITKKAWDGLSEAQHTAMLKVAAETGIQIKTRGRQEGDESVEAMKKRGLQVHTLTPEQTAVWEKFAENVYPQIRGNAVPAETFDQVQKLMKDYRAGKK
jgi:TRAP-type transport system periplasmic protein